MTATPTTMFVTADVASPNPSGSPTSTMTMPTPATRKPPVNAHPRSSQNP